MPERSGGRVSGIADVLVTDSLAPVHEKGVCTCQLISSEKMSINFLTSVCLQIWKLKVWKINLFGFLEAKLLDAIHGHLFLHVEAYFLRNRR